jgi:hypothetical protein
MRQSTKRWLSGFGIALSIAGFYIKNASAYPFLLRIIAPSYVHAKAALAQVHRTGSVGRDTSEFDALATIVEDLVSPLNPGIPREAIALDWLEAQGGGIAFGPASSKRFVNLKMFFRGQQQPVEGELVQIEQAVEASWSYRSLALAVWIFWLGIALAAWPMFVGNDAGRSDAPSTSQTPSTPDQQLG